MTIKVKKQTEEIITIETPAYYFEPQFNRYFKIEETRYCSILQTGGFVSERVDHKNISEIIGYIKSTREEFNSALSKAIHLLTNELVTT